MGKTSRKVQGPAARDTALTKKQIARSRKEARQLRIIWIGVGIVGAILLGVLAFGLIRELVVVPNAPVATVNGSRISQREFEPLLNYRRFRLHDQILSLKYQLQQIDTSSQDNQFIVSFYEQQLQQLESMLVIAHESALDELIEDKLIEQKAAEVSLSVTPEEVSTYLHNELAAGAAQQATNSLMSTETITITPTAIPQSTLDENYQNLLQNMQLSDSEFRDMVRRSLLRDKVQEYLATQVPTTGLIAHVQLIQINMSTTVTTTLQRLESGEDFATVAKEASSLPDVATDGGDIGWVATDQLAGTYGQELEDLVFALEPGKVGKVTSNGQDYVVRVVERNENGPLPEEALTTRRDSALTDWLEVRQTESDIQRLLDAGQVPADPFENMTLATSG